MSVTVLQYRRLLIS